MGPVRFAFACSLKLIYANRAHETRTPGKSFSSPMGNVGIRISSPRGEKQIAEDFETLCVKI